jgi:hypothetical protein
MVPRRDGTKKRRQVDVFVQCPSGPRTFAIGIDVKDTKSPLDIEDMEQLWAKASTLTVDRYVVVSTGGFTSQAREEAERHGVVAMHIQALSFSEFFELDEFTQQIAESSDVALLFSNTPDIHDVAMLESAAIVIEGVEHPLRALAGAYARSEFERNPGVPAGIARILEVRDVGHTWSELRVGGRSIPAPTALRVTWTPRLVRIEGRKFRTQDGTEIFTAVLPAEEGARQISIVATPHPDGEGKQVSITILEASPRRVDV